MFIVKYDNETMLPVEEKTFPMNGYPYFVEEVSGELYVGGINGTSGFIYVNGSVNFAPDYASAPALFNSSS
ncbi:MAG: hypothetical protein D3923_18040 [Candidatus Electrothrix sp. AR3]|nr:hypothetical protein [Candidatus Electrothrix sp. AR3]